ncbi:MAG: methyltransferase [Candidatus Woesearchaeota archaeon]|nr:MAG: methyltransferase [Candidatus Woesearchaeota archaeon]
MSEKQQRRAAKVPLRELNTFRAVFAKDIDKSCRHEKQKDYMLIALHSKHDVKGYDIIEYDFSKKEPRDFRSAITKVLPTYNKFAFDQLGSIAIIEVDEEFRDKEELIAKTLLETNATVKTVLRKDSTHENEFRTQTYKFLQGVETKIATIKENNVTLSFDVEEVYFSVRLSSERKRVAQQVKENESVLVMFSGAGPYAMVIKKMHPSATVTAVEMNPEGHRWAVHNAKINKLDITCVNEDVGKLALGKTFDRIVMPAPKNAEDFLEKAKEHATQGTIIHLYCFGEENELAEKKKRIEHVFSKVTFLGDTVCGQQSPRIYRYCVDFRVD